MNRIAVCPGGRISPILLAKDQPSADSSVIAVFIRSDFETLAQTAPVTGVIPRDITPVS